MLVIAHGRLFYDGPLAGITERFGRHKQVRLQFAGEETPPGLAQFGEVTTDGPVAELKVERDRVATVLEAILDAYTVIDLSIQDPLARPGDRPRLRGRPRTAGIGVRSADRSGGSRRPRRKRRHDHAL
ncbi:MAG: hypothetical protein U0736_23065 [Gemmataceae bacterium]